MSERRCNYCKLPLEACGCPNRGAKWHHPPPSAVHAADPGADVFGLPLVEGRRGTWSQTATGRRVWHLDPRPEDVHIVDIARGIACECRYGRQLCRRGLWYSVAEHSVIVSLNVDPRFARHALIHDAAEAYGFGDVPRPLKYDPRVRSIVAEVETAWERAISEHYRVEWTPEATAEVRRVDDLILADEIDQILASPAMYLERHPPEHRLGVKLTCLQPSQAEWIFLDRFAELFPDFSSEIDSPLHPDQP